MMTRTPAEAILLRIGSLRQKRFSCNGARTSGIFKRERALRAGRKKCEESTDLVKKI
jgi:hypothetical protein